MASPASLPSLEGEAPSDADAHIVPAPRYFAIVNTRPTSMADARTARELDFDDIRGKGDTNPDQSSRLGPTRDDLDSLLDDDYDEDDDDTALSDCPSSPDLGLPIQIHSRPNTPLLPLIFALPGPLIDMETGAMDDAVERHFLTEAQELGLDVPPEPVTMLKPMQANDSTPTVASSYPETQTLPSRNSESTRPTSRSSSLNNERPQTARPISRMVPFASTPTPRAKRSMPVLPRETYTASTPSLTPSRDTTSSRFVKSLRRFSSYTKRRTMLLNKNTHIPSELSVASSHLGSEKDASSTDDQSSGTVEAVEIEMQTGPAPPSIRRKRSPHPLPSLAETTSFLSTSPQSLPAELGEQSSLDEEEEDRREAARQRSLNSRHLEAIRKHQLKEQCEFISHYSNAVGAIRSRYMKQRDEAAQELNESKQSLEKCHAEQHINMENGHLDKEIDLRRKLEQDRQACDTKLKHMEAYCNGRQTMIAGEIPRRKVTQQDYSKLVHQYHVRETMDNLHEAKINVLREKQAQQMDRLAETQRDELDALQDRFDNDEEQRLASQATEEATIRDDFSLKKRRLVWRWKIVEAVERRKLELEGGEPYGELPELPWADEEWLQAAL